MRAPGSPLVERSRQATARSVALRAELAALRTGCAGQLHAARRALWTCDFGMPAGDFYIEGRLEDGTPARASCHLGRSLCDDELRRRAELLIALGEEFVAPSGATLAATLDGPPVAVALTYVRAMSRVEVFHLALEAADSDRG